MILGGSLDGSREPPLGPLPGRSVGRNMSKMFGMIVGDI